MRRALLLALIAGCASDGVQQREGVVGRQAGSRRDQLMLAQAIEEASSRAAMAFADRVHGRTVSLAVQEGAKPGAALLANLLERDLVRGGAAQVKRGPTGAIQLRIMLKAHGLEQASLGDGIEITAFIDADLRLIDGRGRSLQEVKLRVQKVERVDDSGFRTKVEGAVERVPKRQERRSRGTMLSPDSDQETRRDRERRKRKEEARRQAEREKNEAREAAQREEAERLEEERRAAAKRRALAARREIEDRLAETDREAAGGDADQRRAAKEAARRAEDDRYEAERQRRRQDVDSEDEEKSLPPRPQLDHATHCAPEEQIIFSCKVRGAQIVSICASSDLGRRRGWLQYRFGKERKVVRRFPEKLSLSRASFTYAQEQSGESMGLQRVYWSQEERRYEAWVKQVDPFAEEEVASAGFKLFKNDRLHRDWKCVSEYVEDLRSLDGVVLDPE